MFHCKTIFDVFFTVLVAGMMVVLHCTTIICDLCCSFSSWVDSGVTLHNNISRFIYSFSSWGDGSVTLQDNMSYFLHSFSSWGDAGVTLQDLFHVFFTVLAAGVMVVLHCKTIICDLCYSFSSWGDGGVTLCKTMQNLLLWLLKVMLKSVQKFQEGGQQDFVNVLDAASTAVLKMTESTTIRGVLYIARNEETGKRSFNPQQKSSAFLVC